MLLLLSCLAFFSSVNIVISQCSCTNTNDDFLMYKLPDCTGLLNNSAITSPTSVLCCTSYSGTTAVWYNPSDNAVLAAANAIVRVDENRRNELEAIDVIEGFNDGVYTCRVVNETTNELIAELHLGLYQTIGTPHLSTISFSIIQYYDPLIAKLSFNSSNYPPAILSWSNNEVPLSSNDSCVLTIYSHLINKRQTNYTNILLITDSDESCTLNGTYVINVTTDGNNFASTNQTIGIADTPQNIRVTSLNTTRVSVAWSSSMENVIYHIHNINANTSTVTMTSATTVTIPVTNDTIYTLVLFSMHSSLNYCLPSKPKSLFLTTTEPLMPENFSVFTLTSNSIQINWAMFVNTNIPVDQIIIQATNNCSNVHRLLTPQYSGLVSTFVLNELQPGTEYCFRMYVKNSWGVSNGTEVLCAITLFNETSAPSQSPNTINITNATCNDNAILWNQIDCNARNGPFSHYSIQLYNGSNCNNRINSFNTTVPFFNVSNIIRPYSDYCVRIARTNIGDLRGPYSQIKNAKSAECISDKVRDLVVTTTTTKARLSWKPPMNLNGRLIDYCLMTVSGTLSSPLQSLQRCDHMPTTNETIISNLHPNVTYTFFIGARNNAGLGPMVQANATTESIEQINVLTVDWGTGHVTITWRLARHSTEITSYIVKYEINELSNTEVVPPDANSWRFNVSSRPSYTYSFSVLATVTANGTEIRGVNGTTIAGCYGNCSPSPVGAAVGGTIGGVLFLLPVIAAFIAITVVYTKKYLKQERSEIDLVPLNQVIGGSAPVIISKSNDITTKVGEDILMKAEVSGNPFPVIIWYFDNKIIADDNHYELENENMLILHKITSKHAGVYQFTASNALGTVEGHIRVFVQKEEEPTEEVDYPSQIQIEECTNEVPLEKWAEHVEFTREGPGFKEEFQKLQLYNHLSTEAALSTENSRRNRFKTILPYDNNRVKLKVISSRGDCNHDYINASYINGYTRKNQFIATQGPLPQTLVDFWRLVWQEDICCIVMLLSRITEGGTIIRCQQYWPDSGAVAFYGPFKITVERVDDHRIYKERQMILARTDDSNSSSKVIYHYQFNCWPDDGAPSTITPILTLYDAIKIWLELPSPTLIHCSAGVGRTAVLLAIIIGIEQGEKDKKIDVMSVVNKLRAQHMNMVQTEDQYAFIHRALLQAFYCSDTRNIPSANFAATCSKLESMIDTFNMTGYEAHFKALQVLSVKPNKVLRNGGLSYPTLSRSKRFLPPDNYRVELKKRSESDESFIHASYLDGYTQEKLFIVAESPTKATAAHFWQMIMEQNCSVIVMLCDCVEKGEDTCFPYWPAFSESEKTIGDFHIKHHQQSIQNEYTETMFKIRDTTSEEEWSVNLLQIPHWAPNGECSEPRSILAVINRVENIQRKTGNYPIVVHCSDTVTRSGIFCTLYNAIQQMKTEQQVNIYEILTTMRMQKPGLVVTPAHYKMIYDLLRTFLTDFDTYGNFSSTPNLA